MVSKSRERRERSLRSELEGESMDGLVEGGARVLEASLREFWCKARGGGGRLRQATSGGNEGNRREEVARRED